MSREEAQLARLRHPSFERLWAAARRRLEQDPSALEGFISLAHPSVEERRAIGGLLGQDLSRARRPRIRLSQLDERLRSGPAALGLFTLLELLGGPLRDRPGERDRRQARVDEVLAELREGRWAAAPWFEAWIEGLRADGLLARLEGEGALAALGSAGAILDRLPTTAHIASLGAEVSGDTKLLTQGPVGGLVLRALSLWDGAPRPQTAADRRALWERFGVVMDDLASQVLVVGLRAEGTAPLARWLREAAEEGEPLRLTLHQLRRYGLALPPSPIFACENPAVLREAAEALGARCPPLLCAEGQAGSAFAVVAEAARDAGASLLYHGDFDWPGVRMTQEVCARYGAAPWRMTASDYLEAVEALGDQGTAPLEGSAVPTPWDPALGQAMARLGRVVFEEAVTGPLLEDLRAGHAPGPSSGAVTAPPRRVT